MQTVFLIFGITGDLARQKGLPALFALYLQGKLPQDFRIVGLSRKKWSDEEFRAYVVDTLVQSGVTKGQAVLFAELITMVQGEAGAPEGYAALKAAVGTPGRLCIYLSVSPDFYAPIIFELGKNNFLQNAALLIEKPFGISGGDALVLDTLLEGYMPEEKVFRIDHYLAKEGAFDLALLAKGDIVGIGVFLLETIGVEDRGALYDTMGALLDVGQNHMLEILALAAGGVTHRGEVLASLPVMTPEMIHTDTTRGQYAGYAAIAGVAPGSKTETYFKIKTEIVSDKGARIAVVLEAGKSLGTGKKEVVLTYAGGSSRTISLASKANEYERLFADVLTGSRELFVTRSEVEALWHFIDPIKAQWDKGEMPLVPYEPGTDTVRTS